MGDPQTGGWLQLQRFFPRKEEPKPHIRLPSLWVVHWEDDPPAHLALKVSSSYSWEGRPRGLWEIQTPILKSTHKISHGPGPKSEVVIWKKPGSDPHADFGEPPREARRYWSSPWGQGHWWQQFWEVCSTMRKMLLETTILESSL